MPSLPATVAETYRYVVGVDTHAATHSYAVVDDRGSLLDQTTFPTTPAGLRRARDCIGRRTQGDLDSVLIAAEGTGSYGAVLSGVLSDAGYRVVEAPAPSSLTHTTSREPSKGRSHGRLEHLRGSALGFRNLTSYIARSLLETGGFRPRFLHPQL